MYGLVHVALKDLVSSKLGAEVWRDICLRHDAPNAPVSLETYTDHMTSSMIAEVAMRLNMQIPQFLKEFGCHWIVFILRSDYADILRFYGHDFRSCVANLDALHASIGDAMRNAKTPKFSILFANDHSIEIRYSSTRKGLSPFVEGLLNGLLLNFNEQGQISVLRSGDGHTDFLVSMNC